MIPSGSRKSRSTTRLVLCGGLAAIAATLSASPPDSHMGQKVHDHVVLSSQAGSNPCGGVSNFVLRRLLPSGILEPFEIPAGRALVVTDVEWEALPREDGLFVPGSSVVMVIQLGTFGPQAFRSRTIPITEETKGARPGSSEQLTTGFVVGSGVDICPEGAWSIDSSGGSAAGALKLGKVILRGYLIDMPTRQSP